MNYYNLKTLIDEKIKTNGNEEITATVLNEVLYAMVNQIGMAGWMFAGIATKAEDLVARDANTFYLTATPGYYGQGVGVVREGEVAIIRSGDNPPPGNGFKKETLFIRDAKIPANFGIQSGLEMSMGTSSFVGNSHGFVTLMKRSTKEIRIDYQVDGDYTLENNNYLYAQNLTDDQMNGNDPIGLTMASGAGETYKAILLSVKFPDFDIDENTLPLNSYARKIELVNMTQKDQYNCPPFLTANFFQGVGDTHFAAVIRSIIGNAIRYFSADRPLPANSILFVKKADMADGIVHVTIGEHPGSGTDIEVGTFDLQGASGGHQSLTIERKNGDEVVYKLTVVYDQVVIMRVLTFMYLLAGQTEFNSKIIDANYSTINEIIPFIQNTNIA